MVVVPLLIPQVVPTVRGPLLIDGALPSHALCNGVHATTLEMVYMLMAIGTPAPLAVHKAETVFDAQLTEIATYEDECATTADEHAVKTLQHNSVSNKHT